MYVGRPFGIPVYFHLSWVLLAGYITYAYAPSFSHNGESPGARSYSLALQFLEKHQHDFPFHEMITGRYTLDQVNIAMQRGETSGPTSGE